MIILVILGVILFIGLMIYVITGKGKVKDISRSNWPEEK